MSYRCLRYGSAHGEPASNSSENWYWRIVENGRIGPFCSQGCSKEFRLADEPIFSLAEWDRLHFLKWRVLNGELSDNARIAS
ncbi:MAG TPA: hypothetical protein VF221_08700 [Chloroflexota bacterium]